MSLRCASLKKKLLIIIIISELCCYHVTSDHNNLNLHIFQKTIYFMDDYQEDEYIRFDTLCQQRTFVALKSVLLSFPIEIIHDICDLIALCTNCNDSEKADEHWQTFQDGSILCDNCIKQMCLCRNCKEIKLTPLGLPACRCCQRPICDQCVVDFQCQTYCISCFEWRSQTPEGSDVD